MLFAVREISLYLRSVVKAPTPPAAIAMAIADVVAGIPSIPTAAAAVKPAAGAATGPAVPPVPSVAYVANAAIPIAPKAIAHATWPVARILIVFFARSPSISISSAPDFRASPSSFSVLTFRAISFPLSFCRMLLQGKTCLSRIVFFDGVAAIP
ncbi:hypothetical protein AE621_01940 [Acidovorax sp. SD340]|nr:hypothetical protein AE621_01940 [Acidovorax sp. SD340]